MTTGLSGTYAINDVDFSLQPTSGKWTERTRLGVDGAGHPVYPQVRGFEMTWNLISTADAQQIIGMYNAVSNTGTAVVCLPEWNNAHFEFKNYSGCTLQEPEAGEYFQGWITDFRLLVLNVRTN